MSEAPVLLVLTASAAETAGRAQAALPGSEIHGRRGRAQAAEVWFEDPLAHLRQLFLAGRPIVGLCAAGVLIRALAPLLADKRGEPPVVALAEDGSVAVPLLGGHRGANALAERLAAALGGRAAITTAGELRFGVALDAPPPGYRLANPEHAKAAMAALLDGESLSIEGEADWLAPLPRDAAATQGIVVTEKALAGGPERLVYHPARLALGVGCERGCDSEELAELVRGSLAEAGLAAGSIALVASLDLKADEPAVHALADSLGVPARFYPADRLEAETPRLSQPSELVYREVGCHGVAEGAALASVGPEGALVLGKRKSARATCALALSPQLIDPERCGRARGRLSVVGIGPGEADWRTPEATAMIGRASDLVGYRLYLDLLGPLADGKTRHAYALGEEELRVRAALALAAEGREVALVCSGDAGIYAMASLVFELLERGGEPAWRRIDVQVAPGISALQAAAARAGAPLGHDFCCISLSDLLTPWPAIERRLRAAAEGDFVVAFYNPVSRRRRDQLARARDILLTARPGDTPVVLASNLGRPGERLRLRRLDELQVGEVDMLTLVLVGSSETRRLARGDGGAWVYTPRGYAGKAATAAEPEQEVTP
jgi:cobalt-precorrin 5A hydrolase/precorrin-3B C17-methyltransferase